MDGRAPCDDGPAGPWASRSRDRRDAGGCPGPRLPAAPPTKPARRAGFPPAGRRLHPEGPRDRGRQVLRAGRGGPAQVPGDRASVERCAAPSRLRPVLASRVCRGGRGGREGDRAGSRRQPRARGPRRRPAGGRPVRRGGGHVPAHGRARRGSLRPEPPLGPQVAARRRRGCHRGPRARHRRGPGGGPAGREPRVGAVAARHGALERRAPGGRGGRIPGGPGDVPALPPGARRPRPRARGPGTLHGSRRALPGGDRHHSPAGLRRDARRRAHQDGPGGGGAAPVRARRVHRAALRAQPGSLQPQLATFYLDHDTKLDVALALARRELDVRRDVYAQDLLAWALYKNGQPGRPGPP